MTDDTVAWARTALDRGQSPEKVVQRLVSNGYDRTVAEDIVAEAQTARPARPPDGDASSGISGKTVALAAVGILAVIAIAGAALQPRAAMDTARTVPVIGDALDAPAGQDADTTTFADLTERDGTYRVAYNLTEDGEVSEWEDLTAAQTATWRRMDITAVAGGSRLNVSMYTHRETETTVFCGDTLRSVFRSLGDGNGTGPVCTHVSIVALIMPMFVPSADAFDDDLDGINVTAAGSETIAGRTCERYTIDYHAEHLYDEIITPSQEQALEMTARESENATRRIEGRLSLCVDPGTGAALETHHIGQEASNDSTVMSTTNMTMRATAFETDVASSAVTPPVDTVLTATCPDNATDTGEAVLLTLDGEGAVDATLTVNGENRSLTLTPFRNTRIDLAAADVATGENSFALHAAGNTATDTCRYSEDSLF